MEVQTLQLAEVPVPSEGTVPDPLDVCLLCVIIFHHMMLVHVCTQRIIEVGLKPFISRMKMVFWHGGEQ